MKRCAGCKQVLSEDKFYALPQNGRGKVQSKCIECHRKGSRDCQRLKREYLHLKTDRCDCCWKKTDKLHLDHCHKTGEFRGWICRSCNLGIGNCGDDVLGMVQCLSYVRIAERRIAEMAKGEERTGEGWQAA